MQKKLKKAKKHLTFVTDSCIIIMLNVYLRFPLGKLNLCRGLAHLELCA